jgi:hypothetical protein
MAKKRIAIIACKNIKGVSCVAGCLKCFKGISEKVGFGRGAWVGSEC